jgi:group I intron endonuclease
MLIYRVTNTVNGKVYIGKWRGSNVRGRWNRHCYAAKRNSPFYIHRAIRKYGADAFTVEVLHHAKTKEELRKMETFFIVLHQSQKPENGYNMTMGGEGLSNPTDETREKLRIARKRNPYSPKGTIRSLEARLSTSAALKGRPPNSTGFRGHKHSVESRALISVRNLEHPHRPSDREAAFGNHKRWHINRQIAGLGCEFCEQVVAANA